MSVDVDDNDDFDNEYDDDDVATIQQTEKPSWLRFFGPGILYNNDDNGGRRIATPLSFGWAHLQIYIFFLPS